MIKTCYVKDDTESSNDIQMQVYIKNKAGYLNLYALVFKYNPFFNEKPALLVLLCPIATHKDFSSILFDSNGHILSVTEKAASRFGITQEFIYTPNRSKHTVFDLFKGLKSCMDTIEADKAEEIFYYIELDKSAVEGFTKYHKISRQPTVQLNEYDRSKNDEMNKKQTNSIEVMARIIPVDPPYKDIYILNFNFSDNKSFVEHEETITNSEMDFSQELTARSNFKSTKVLPVIDDIKVLPENAHFDNTDDDNETKNLLNLNHKTNNLDLLKNFVAEKRTSKIFRICYISIALLSLLSIVLYSISVFYQNYYLNKSLKLQSYIISLKNVHLAVWHIIYYVRDLDWAQKHGISTTNYVSFNKKIIYDNIILIKSELSALLEAHQLYVLQENPTLNEHKMHIWIESSEHLIKKPVGDIYLQFIESASNIIKSDSMEFNSSSLYPDFHFIIANGLYNLSVR